MKLTLFINPEHRAEDDLGAKLAEHIEQVRLARELGYDGITIGHHLCYADSVWFPPFETLARLVPVCEGMNIGTCMLLAPLFEPVHVAAQAAYLDVMSGGRLVLGLAPGWARSETALVQVAHPRRFGRFQESLQLIKALWSGEPTTFSGQHFQCQEARLTLRPVQSPRPALWLGGSVDAAIARAARNADTVHGDTWVASSHLTNEVIARQAEIFGQTLEAQGKPFPTDFPVLRNIVVAPDRRTALRDAGPALAESYRLFEQWGLFRDVVGTDADFDRLDALLEDRVILGSPRECAEALRTLCETTGANHIVTRVQWLGLDQRVVLRSIEMLANEVRPLLQ